MNQLKIIAILSFFSLITMSFVISCGCDDDDDDDDDGRDDDEDDDADDDANDDADDEDDDDIDDDADDDIDDDVDDDQCDPGIYSGDQETEAWGIAWNSIPAGCYYMGCSDGDANCDLEEKPSHAVNISSFKMTETEITQAQYQAVIGANPSEFAGCANCPVEMVNWDEALAFCAAVGGALPTEAQWEYAARAGTTARFICGDDPSCLGDIAWYTDNSGAQTQAVKQKNPNDYGLYDMLGNVIEWLNDWYGADYYSLSPLDDPQGPASGTGRIMRGSSWLAGEYNLRVSQRTYGATGGRGPGLGFRCARED